METIAVTGGAGFIGANLARALVSSGREVRIIDDFSTGSLTNLDGLKCQVSKISILDETNLKKALEGCSYIFHLAARGSVPRSIKEPRTTIQNNVNGTLNVLEIARQTGAAVSFVSSSSVYGSNLEIPRRETMWTCPISPYGASKLAGEALASAYAHSFGMSIVNYRFFNVFGPGQRPDHEYAAVIPKWIWRILNGEAITLEGNGEQARDFSYVDDVIKILIDGMEAKLIHPSPINLAFGQNITLNFLIDKLRKRWPNLKVVQKAPRNGDIQFSQNDPSLLKSLFSRLEITNFDDALDRTIDWIEKKYSNSLNK